MKKTSIVFALGLGLFLNTLNVQAADIQPIAPGTEASNLADTANRIFMVKNLRTKTKAYRIVAMDSVLNGSSGNTGLILVGDEVGSEAGYEAAFQLTPTEQYSSIVDARVVGNELEVTFSVMGNYKKTVKKRVSFDSKSNTLKTR